MIWKSTLICTETSHKSPKILNFQGGVMQNAFNTSHWPQSKDAWVGTQDGGGKINIDLTLLQICLIEKILTNFKINKY